MEDDICEILLIFYELTLAEPLNRSTSVLIMCICNTTVFLLAAKNFPKNVSSLKWREK